MFTYKKSYDGRFKESAGEVKSKLTNDRWRTWKWINRLKLFTTSSWRTMLILDTYSDSQVRSTWLRPQPKNIDRVEEPEEKRRKTSTHARERLISERPSNESTFRDFFLFRRAISSRFVTYAEKSEHGESRADFISLSAIEIKLSKYTSMSAHSFVRHTTMRNADQRIVNCNWP